MNPDAERVFFLDLQSLHLTSDRAEPWKIWAFVSGMAGLNRLPWDQFHLISLKTTTAEEGELKALAERGLVTSFEEAARFIADLSQGRIAPGTPYRLCLHLRQLEQEQDPFLLEREAFARQFNGSEPALGIGGFLNKKRAPFGLNPKIRAGLQELLDWLSH